MREIPDRNLFLSQEQLDSLDEHDPGVTRILRDNFLNGLTAGGSTVFYRVPKEAHDYVSQALARIERITNATQA
jgi:hypothetical protein